MNTNNTSLGTLDLLHVYGKHEVELVWRRFAVKERFKTTTVNSDAVREIAEGISLSEKI